MENHKIPSVSDWIFILLLLSIPIVNIIVLLYWAISNSTEPIKANFAKATLIWFVIIIFFWFLFLGAIIGSALTLAS